MVDVEADGPIPGDYSMVCFGAVDVSDPSRTFYGELQPISGVWIPNALKVSGFSREDTMKFPDPWETMNEFEKWLLEKKNPMFIADNNGFDYMFICWYFWHFLGRNPFGHSSTNLGSLYKGLVKSVFKNFKYLRKTKHDHNPVNDAMGNVEAFHKMVEMGLKVKK
jgi:hypothetical protein